MFGNLSNNLQSLTQKLRGQDKMTEANIDGALSEIRRNLLESDVSLKAVKLFTARVKERALGEEVLRGVKPGEQFTKIIYDSLVEILGGDPTKDPTEDLKDEDADKLKLSKLNEKLDLSQESTSILLLGLQGAGKTTAAGKLAYRFKKEGYKPLLVPCDLQRPAAVLQLKILAENAGVDFLNILEEGSENAYAVNSPLKLKELATKHAQENENNVLIFDTAGRLQVDTDLMAELLLLEKQVKPQEKLLVVDSLIGQEAANIAETFNTQIGISGVVLTKLDSDTRGGAALSITEATKKPIKLASVGEKLEDLENFHPDRVASRILGMGDVLSLVEKAEEKIQEEEAKKLEEELLKGNFNYKTFVQMQSMISKLGDFGSIFKMMGMGGMLSNMGLNMGDQDAMLGESEKQMKKFQIAISSMSKQERLKPELIDRDKTAKSRRERIAKGSGQKVEDINKMVSSFNQMSKLFKNLGPLMGMMGKGSDAEGGAAGANPMAALGNMLGGGGGQNPMAAMQQMAGAAQEAGVDPLAGLSRKQQKAMKQMGLGGKAKSKSKKVKKGTKPKIKGWD